MCDGLICPRPPHDNLPPLLHLASNLVAMASNLLEMASELRRARFFICSCPPTHACQSRFFVVLA